MRTDEQLLAMIVASECYLHAVYIPCMCPAIHRAYELGLISYEEQTRLHNSIETFLMLVASSRRPQTGVRLFDLLDSYICRRGDDLPRESVVRLCAIIYENWEARENIVKSYKAVLAIESDTKGAAHFCAWFKRKFLAITKGDIC